MSSNDNLPVILVSAIDVAAASAIIMELIHGSTEPPQPNGAGAGDEECDGFVWPLENKYYTARVCLLPCADRAAPALTPAPARDVQAHLIYLTENECEDGLACSRRADAVRARLSRGAVRLVAARCGAPPPALRVAARSLRYELVPLEPEHEPEHEHEAPEPRGVERLREALHAHVWPGLARRDVDPPHALSDLLGGDSSAESSDGESWGEWRRADEAGAVERAAQFAAALALLPAGSERASDATDASDAARRLRAEQLVGAFCRALGHRLPREGGGDGDGEGGGDGDGEGGGDGDGEGGGDGDGEGGGDGDGEGGGDGDGEGGGDGDGEGGGDGAGEGGGDGDGEGGARK